MKRIRRLTYEVVRRALAVPYVVWMGLFVVAPLIMVVVYAFTASDGAFTLGNFEHAAAYAQVFGRSLLLALVATLICLVIGYPLAYALSKEGARLRKVVMMLIMLPMWMNFLLRTYAWMSLLENTGLLNSFFKNIGLIDLVNLIRGWVSPSSEPLEFFPMINTQFAVVLGMVYNYLPFMVLPIYSVIIKIEPSVIEAAQDLGADGRRVFSRVVFPLSLPGVLSGVTMTFVPSVSTFVINRLLGGSKSMLLGDLIEMQFLGSAYNPQLGSAISLIMMVLILVLMQVMNTFGGGDEEASLL
ncbi:MAG: ABC transporter permease [Oscillospiraceae bacterium]|jgi:spermidine/putrescine transport system permease protein|nr:ABC transporter permease [Oscillospiraceae bacterium]